MNNSTKEPAVIWQYCTVCISWTFELEYYGLKIGRHKPGRYSKKLWDSFILNQRMELDAELQRITLFWVLSFMFSLSWTKEWKWMQNCNGSHCFGFCLSCFLCFVGLDNTAVVTKGFLHANTLTHASIKKPYCSFLFITKINSSYPKNLE